MKFHLLRPPFVFFDSRNLSSRSAFCYFSFETVVDLPIENKNKIKSTGITNYIYCYSSRRVFKKQTVSPIRSSSSSSFFSFSYTGSSFPTFLNFFVLPAKSSLTNSNRNFITITMNAESHHTSSPSSDKVKIDASSIKKARLDLDKSAFSLVFKVFAFRVDDLTLIESLKKVLKPHLLHHQKLKMIMHEISPDHDPEKQVGPSEQERTEKTVPAPEKKKTAVWLLTKYVSPTSVQNQIQGEKIKLPGNLMWLQETQDKAYVVDLLVEAYHQFQRLSKKRKARVALVHDVNKSTFDNKQDDCDNIDENHDDELSQDATFKFLHSLNIRHDSTRFADITVDYDIWSFDDILSQLLPKNVTIPSGFETVGHIAHLNLNAEHDPYRFTIGAVLFDKLHGNRIRTVVNKIQSTGGPYRIFQMELLAGEPLYEARVHETGCVFDLDFSSVYWNSRLGTEHARIVNLMTKTDILADAFAGVGPFAIPAAKRAERVYANDLNPDSVKYLNMNIESNNVGHNVVSSCGCARDFLLNLIHKHIPFTRVVMNFPSGAPEFLDLFYGAYKDHPCDIPLPIIHCYCFVSKDPELGEREAKYRVARCLVAKPTPGRRRHDDDDDDGKEKAEVDAEMDMVMDGADVNAHPEAGKELDLSQFGLEDLHIEVRIVRNVSPKKNHVCVTFQLPEKIARAQV